MPKSSAERADLPVSEALIKAALRLRRETAALTFSEPVACVYNPLQYAWATHEEYLRRYGAGNRKVVFVGMNPGPFGMVQTGVPFGQVAAVRDWLKIEGVVEAPIEQHPKRQVTGFACERSEISGERLWGLFAARFGTAAAFFKNHFVLNYCPLAFVEASGRNRTPDKLPAGERAALFRVCNQHLASAVAALAPQWVIGIGDFAFERVTEAVTGTSCRTGRVLHPSPASPAANRDWAGAVTRQLQTMGVWD